MFGRIVLAVLPFVLTVPVTAEEATGPADAVGIADAVAPSLVRVQFTLQYDRGQAPQGRGWAERCPNCGEFHTFYDFDQLVTEERPLETAGFLLTPTRVVATDPMIHPRFVKAIRVRFREQTVEARPAAFGIDREVVYLDLARPLADAKPLTFHPEAKPPFRAVTYDYQNGSWTITVQPSTPMVSVTDTNHRFVSVPSSSLIVDKAGVPVALSMNDELPLDDSWKGSPLDWPTLAAPAMTERLVALEKAVGQSLLRVELTFRSPKNQNGDFSPNYYSGWHDDQDEDATQRSAVGVLTEGTKVLVLANLRPKVTARLAGIQVYPLQGEPVSAAFAGSLADYGAFLATAEKPLPGPISFSSEAILKFRNKLLLSAEILVRGEKRVAWFDHSRFPSFDVRWKGLVYPDPIGDVENLFVFDGAGNLVALPVRRRQRPAIEPSDFGGEAVLTPAAYLKDVLADPAKYVDSGNSPLPEDQENRIAWMGVELQPLNRDLARANNVAHLTNDGETGAIVSHVYPDSPAARAGIEAGDVLLRLSVKDLPKPLEVVLQPDQFEGDNFSWDDLDEVPDQYADQLPAPWPAAENPLTRALTDLGLGKSYQAEFSRGGQIVIKDFQIVQSPPHFESAARYKSTALGLTVRDLTYEVRRYFQKKPDDPGVIVSRIEPGGKASVAGIKPFEIITLVNEKPVPTVKEFEKLIADQDNLRLSVNRMTVNRLVKIDMTTPVENSGPDDKTDAGGLKPLRETGIRP